MSFPYRIEQLSSQRERSSFACGSPPLDCYIRERAMQDMRRLVAKCFVAVAAGEARVLGFYTLAAASLPFELLPQDLKRRLPRYPTVPVARLGRLAVDQSLQGNKLGATMLSDALLRSSRPDLGVFAFIVDAKDDKAEAFYAHYGFENLAPRRLFMPLASAASSR